MLRCGGVDMADATATIMRRQASRPARPRPIGADRYERLLAWAALALFAAALVAIVRGRAAWGTIPGTLWGHLATVLLATGLTPVILLGRRGTVRHRLLGRVWVVAMLGTAALTLGVRVLHPGHWSWIHLLSLLVIVQAPILWWTAATGRIEQHRQSVRGLVTGALVIAGFFTFPFGRLLGRWLMG